MSNLAFATFFVSGLAALLYQVVWQRMLVLFSGADVYSATLVVAAFMAGLGGGSLAGGHLADRVSRRTSLLLFCVAELGVATFGVVSSDLYHGVLYERLGPLGLSQSVVGLVLFGSLLLPTTLMGASLPLLSRALTGGLDAAAATVGGLYGFNTMGAALGALVGTWWLLPQIGLGASLRVAAALNVLCALALVPFALLGHRWTDLSATAVPVATAPARPSERLVTFPFWGWTLIYGCSGFVALSLEITWFRLLGVMMKSTGFTFGTLLTLFLAGLGLGALVGRGLSRRVRQPGVVFLWLQAGVALTAGVLLIGVLAWAQQDIALTQYFAAYEPLNVRDQVRLMASATVEQPSDSALWLFSWLYVYLPTALVVPSTLLMGASFPVLQRLAHQDLAYLGRRIGTLLVANIIGSLLGAVVTGWALLGLLGTAGTLRVIVLASASFSVMAVVLTARIRNDPRARVAVYAAASVGVFVAVAVVMPDASTLWSRLHGSTAGQMIVEEDASGLSVIKTRQDGFGDRPVVFVNGLGQSQLPYGGIHTALAVVPAFVHGSPRTAAVIGLGSGDTVHAMAGHPAIEQVVGVEIVRPQLQTLRRLRQRYPYPGLIALLESPVIQQVFGDGRGYLMRSGRLFDLIEADALRPTSAYAGNLYSKEYFTLLRDHLALRGLAVTWLSSPRVRDTFIQVFPHVVVLREMLLGSNQPIVLDRAAIAAQVSQRQVASYYQRAGIDIVGLLERHLENTVTIGPEFDRTGLTDINTDLDPRDEFDLGLR